MFETMTLRAHSSWVNGCALSRDGKMALSASFGQNLYPLELDGTIVQNLSGHSLGLRGCALSRDYKLAMFASSDKTCGCELSDDGRLALSASSDKTCILWNTVG